MATYTEATRPADDEARILARQLLAAAQHGALAYSDPMTGLPGISRISLLSDGAENLLTLVSHLAQHTAGLARSADCAVLVGEPGPKGDALVHPRLMIRSRAEFVERETETHSALRELWLEARPKAKLYIDLPDFRFVRLRTESALLNAGFGRAYRLSPHDLAAS